MAATGDDAAAGSATSSRGARPAIDPRWSAPEVIARQEYGQGSDVYAFGLVMWQLLTWQMPFEGRTGEQIAVVVVEGCQHPPVPDGAAAAQVRWLQAGRGVAFARLCRSARTRRGCARVPGRGGVVQECQDEAGLCTSARTRRGCAGVPGRGGVVQEGQDEAAT